MKSSLSWHSWFGGLASLSLLLTSCGPATPADPLAALVQAAKAEGQLNVMALPHDWCNYGEVISGFKTKYGLQVNEFNPNAGSKEEIEAIKAGGDEAPDILDVGFGYGQQLTQEQLVTPYKVATWDSIPADAKSPTGHWYSDYYGVMSIAVNRDFVSNPPQEWADLLKPEYKGMVALAGDPLVSSQAQMAIYAVNLAMGGSPLNLQPGLDFFKQMAEQGNLVSMIGTQATMADGRTPIVLWWDYNALNNQHALSSSKIEVIVPKSVNVAGVYIQAINATAKHPNAAKLWMEYVYSDEGQLLWLKGLCHPIRYQDLVARDMVPAELAAQLPPAEAYASAVFPSSDHINMASRTIVDEWVAQVGLEIKAAP